MRVPVRMLLQSIVVKNALFALRLLEVSYTMKIAMRTTYQIVLFAIVALRPQAAYSATTIVAPYIIMDMTIDRTCRRRRAEIS